MSKYTLGKSMPDFMANFGGTLHLPGGRFTGIPLFQSESNPANFETMRWTPVPAEQMAPDLFCDTIAGCIAAMNTLTGGDGDTLVFDTPVQLKNGPVERIKSDSDGNSFLYAGAYQNCHNGYELTPQEKHAVYFAVFDTLRSIEQSIKACGENSPQVPPRMEPPLRVAAMEGNAERIREIIRRGTPVDTASKFGMTALHIAANYGHPECVSILLAAGANPNATDDLGRSPLHLAPGVMMDAPKRDGENRNECRRLLIAAGANPKATDKYGNPPAPDETPDYDFTNGPDAGKSKSESRKV